MKNKEIKLKYDVIKQHLELLSKIYSETNDPHMRGILEVQEEGFISLITRQFTVGQLKGLSKKYLLLLLSLIRLTKSRDLTMTVKTCDWAASIFGQESLLKYIALYWESAKPMCQAKERNG